MSKRTRLHRPNPTSEPLMMRVFRGDPGQAFATSDRTVYEKQADGSIRRVGVVPADEEQARIDREPKKVAPAEANA